MSTLNSKVEALMLIEKLRQFLDSPSRWTQGVSAREQGGNPISEYSDRAVCWCLTGALNRLAHIWRTSSEPARRLLCWSLGGTSIVVFNDNHTHQEVLDFLDRFKLS